jgi:hypothetical protein
MENPFSAPSPIAQRTGSTRPLPAPLIGNTRNAAESNDLALGSFEDSAFFDKNQLLYPTFSQVCFLIGVAGEFVPIGDCHLVSPNSLQDDGNPEEWENAKIIGLLKFLWRHFPANS